MSTRTLAVVSAGLRQPSSTRLLADRLTEATRTALSADGVSVNVEVIELRQHARALADTLLTGFAAGPLEDALRLVGRANGLIAVTPIFTGSYSGLFKTFFDVIDPDSLDGTPVLVGATGGTARHSLALEHAVRPMFTYLHAVVVPTAVYAASEDWGAVEATGTALSERVDRAAGEFARLVAAHDRPAADDPYVEPTPFEHLLNSRLSSP